MNEQHHPFFATAALGLEPLLAQELEHFGMTEVKQVRAGVRFSGSLRDALYVCLWSRLASRMLLPLAEFAAADPEQLYAGVQGVDWSRHLEAGGTLAVDCAVSQSTLTHSRFIAQKTKDAIVDQFRARCGERPSVAMERPDIRLNLYLHRDRASLSLDLSGESLHRRGYRDDGVNAPLKENLAAAILLRAGWPQMCEKGGALVDPLCGSGTLPVEGALMATDTAPGLYRPYYGFSGWKQHDAATWQALLNEAHQRRETGLARPGGAIVGYDSDSRAIRAAWEHATNAGVADRVHFEKRTLADFTLPAGMTTGLVVANPPYGERLGRRDELPRLYNQLGEMLARHCRGWRAAIITSEPQLGRSIGLRAGKIHVLYNGALKCQLLQFELDAGNRWQSLEEGAGRAVRKPLSDGARMFANRLEKNLKKLRKWAGQEGIDCYRLYDADLPEYAVAVDLYGDEVHLQEYRAPKSVDEDKAARRLQEVQDALPQVLDLPPEKVHLKVRQRQKGTQQYEKQARRGLFKEVREGNCRFLVNLSDYLDTGLFLDHRLTRQRIQALAVGRRFLNLFAYTGTATVHALKGGAVKTTTVDMSRTYLDWARKNIELNGFDSTRQELVQADCLQWLKYAKGRYDLIFLDPPTFSNSSSMTDSFDVQRDHVSLIRDAMKLLTPGGRLLFSTNLRSFRMDVDALAAFQPQDISAVTLPLDFARNPRIHQCWELTAG